jgi:hypothetical protein
VPGFSWVAAPGRENFETVAAKKVGDAFDYKREDIFRTDKLGGEQHIMVRVINPVISTYE